MSNATHILQAKCDRAANEVWARTHGRCQVTLIAFYADVSGTAFVTTLDHATLAATVEAVIARWTSEKPVGADPEVWLPNFVQLTELTEFFRDALPFSVRFALICGSGSDLIYASFAPREDMQSFFEKVFLPHVRAQLVLTPLAESPA